MPTSKHRRERRAYRPQPRRIPLVYRICPEDERKLKLVPHVELNKLLDGTATEETWHTLAFRLSVGQVLANRHFENLAKDIMAAALVAIIEVGKRYRDTGRWGASGDQYRAVGLGLSLTDEMQELTTRREQLAAHEYVFRVGGTSDPARIGEVVDVPSHPAGQCSATACEVAA